jgi:AcrR family transcriptional regulator
MAEQVKPRRRYHSARRAEQAAATQRQIIEVARRLFQERGYAATTITTIAAEAGVSAETIYAVFGSKRGILARLHDVSLVGDSEAIPVLEREWIAKIRREPDQRQQVRLLAHTTRRILEYAGPLHAIIRSAAATEPELEALRLTHQEQRLAVQTEFVRILAAAGPLRQGLTVEKAGEIYWTLASPEVHHLLTTERGWSKDQYETWLRDALAAQLLPCDPHAS